MAKVSVIIPTYNRSGMVREAVGCALGQTFGDLEVVVIDDGSTDDTRSVIEAIGDSRIRYFYKENGGCASARNYGLRQCSTEYIAMLDSDDLWPADFLETMLARLESQPEYGAAYSLISARYPDGSGEIMHKAEMCKSGHITEELFRRSFIWLQTTVFRGSVLAGVAFDESMRNGADTDMLLRLSMRIQFLFVPELTATLRVGHDLAPRMDHSGFNCNRIRSLERFYYRLGGSSCVSRNFARRKFSHAHRSVGKNYYRHQCRCAAMAMFRRAIRYWPYDVRLYGNLARAFLLDKDKDSQRGWKMPDPLGDIGL